MVLVEDGAAQDSSEKTALVSYDTNNWSLLTACNALTTTGDAGVWRGLDLQLGETPVQVGVQKGRAGIPTSYENVK